MAKERRISVHSEDVVEAVPGLIYDAEVGIVEVLPDLTRQTVIPIGGTGGPPTGAAGGDLASTYPNPHVAAIHETSGPTKLTVGAVADGDVLKRVGGTLVGASPTAGTVTSVTAGDSSIVIGGTADAPTVETATLDVIAADHAPAGDWSNNSHKITHLEDGTAPQDAVALSQVPVQLTPTAVKTGAYNASAGDFVPCNATAGAFTVTLPTAPADKTVIAVKMVATAGGHAVTIAAGGADVFNITAGATSISLASLFKSVVLQYVAAGAIWYVVSGDE